MRRVACLLVAAGVIGALAVAAQQPTWYSACANGTRALPADAPTLPGQAQRRAALQTTYNIVTGYDASCAAYGFYNDDILTTGWGYLHIESNAQLDGPTQSYAAGYLEGIMTATRIFQSKVNSLSQAFPNSTVPTAVSTFIGTQNKWIDQQIEANPHSDYWLTVANQYTQIQGMFDGYVTGSDPVTEPMTLEDMLILNLIAEVGDMQAATDLEYRASIDVQRMHDLEKVKHTLDKQSHCSALIRLSPDGQDLFAAHTTWTSYQTMLRIYKYYNIPGQTGAVSQQFSSYPACLSSIDDYYQTGNNMVVIETTNNVANVSLYNLVTPYSVPTFVRVVVANQLAATGETWAMMYSDYNSGTYNNQWMVVDMKQFTPGQPTRAGTLWIASQIPGRVETADVTTVLTSQGYWASYNIPYFQDLWYALGYGTLVQQYGEWGSYLWSYESSFRALIFKRDAPNVATIEDMQAIIQENNWQTDPLSKGSAELAICNRQDLSSGPLGSAGAFGAIDAKLSSASLMQSGQPQQVLAKSGPTVESQPPFVWSTSQWASLPHEGMPDEFNFAWQNFVVATPPAKEQPAIALE